MLHRLEIENFYSIRDPVVIDLRAAHNAPDEPGRLAPLWRGSSERAPKVIALFGANASGKSNVLKALSFLAWFVKDSFGAAPNAPMHYNRFNDVEASSLPTRLAIHFSGPAKLDHAGEPDGPQCRYAYQVALGGPGYQQEVVLSESLIYWPSGGGRQVRLFARDSNGCVTSVRDFTLAGYRQALEKILRTNVSVISTLAQLKHPLALLLWRAAARVRYNILIEKQDFNDEWAAGYYAGNPKLLDLLNQQLARIGLGVNSMQLRQGATGPVAWFEHTGLGHALPAQLESHGTRQFVKIFPFLARTLETGGIAVIDELDLAIHPLILPEIVRWFHDSERNPHNAQLWMTCQNASLLEDLTKEEVLLCEKDARGRTTVYSLRDVQSVRREDNYYRKYLAGVYGAIPHLG